MNDQTTIEAPRTQVATGNELIVLDPEKYVAAVFASHRDQLQAAKQSAEGVTYDIATRAGMETAVKLRAAFRTIRIEAEKVRVQRKAPILEIGRLLDTRYKQLEAEVISFESRFDADIKAEEARKENERAERERIERERVERIRANIEAIKKSATEAFRLDAAGVQAIIDDLSAEPFNVTSYAEFAEEAQNAYDATLEYLRDTHTAKAKSEAEARQLAAEREELARLRRAEEERNALARAEQERLDREARERRAEEDRKAQEKRDADEAAARARHEAAEREFEQRRKAEEAERIARQRADEAERERVATIRASIDSIRALSSAAHDSVTALCTCIDNVRRIHADHQFYAEFTDEARATISSTVDLLTQRLNARREVEESQRRADEQRLQQERETEEQRQREAGELKEREQAALKAQAAERNRQNAERLAQRIAEAKCLTCGDALRRILFIARDDSCDDIDARDDIAIIAEANIPADAPIIPQPQPLKTDERTPRRKRARQPAQETPGRT